MFNRILFPLDLSERSLHMFDHLPELRGLGAEEAILLFVTVPGQDVSAEQRSTLDRIGRGLEDASMSPREVIASGDPVDEILKVAEREEADLIAMTSSGKGRVKELFVGSTCFGVLRSAARPVLLHKASADAGSSLLERALVPLDLTSCPIVADEVVPSLIRHGLSEALLFHVVPSSDHSIDDQARFEEAADLLDRIKERLAGKGCDVTTHVHFGTVSYNILEAAQEIGASIIVLGTHRRSVLRDVVLGGNSEDVIRRSPFPLLVVPCER